MYPKISWPNNKKFAFTIFDDTDGANLRDNKLVYDYLDELGFKTTKSVWVSQGKNKSIEAGITCEDKEYLNWLTSLKEKGFEIGYHNTTFNSSKRKEIDDGLQKFKRFFNHYPITMANHYDNKENIYWGSNRLTGFQKTIYNILTRFKWKNYYQGHDEQSSFFWGDLCKKHITYVRNFVFSDINTLKSCPYMPYKDETKPYVNYWFASSEGNDSKTFNRCLSDKNQDRLEKEGGACIMYTHFSAGFCQNGMLSEDFKKQMKRLSQKDGWFVPTFTLLDYLREKNKEIVINARQRASMERKWLINKLFLGST